jgi:hypothetical protein
MGLPVPAKTGASVMALVVRIKRYGVVPSLRYGITRPCLQYQ